MTQCTGAPADKWLEPYLAGTLEDAHAQAFEEHYFDCPVCLAQVQAMQAVTAELRRNPLSVPAKKVLAWPVPWRALAAAAALLAAVWLGYRWEFATPPAHNTAVHQAPPAPSPVTPATPALSQLADLTLPPYQASSLRGEAEDAAFRTGMKAYGAADCSEALPQLIRVPAQSADARAARLYAGACQMQLKQWDRAAATLQGVVAKGDSPQQEAAMYLLAQVSLARSDADSARRQLKQVIALRGDFEPRARHQLARLGPTAN
ncbi:MAG TPA: zf-HC2 domain-containing protein [Terracidiphilus sp.]|nr:zf-HC2 domain-containing protein [Terracidiphilus sp.]